MPPVTWSDFNPFGIQFGLFFFPSLIILEQRGGRRRMYRRLIRCWFGRVPSLLDPFCG